MADTKILGTIYDFYGFGASGAGIPEGKANPDFGNSFAHLLPRRKTASLLGPNGTPVLAAEGEGVGAEFGTASDAYFNQRYYPGATNYPLEDYEITLTETAGVYDYSGNYVPINDLGFGNQGELYNYWFSFASKPQGFFYAPGQYVHVRAPHQVLVYVNGVRLEGIAGYLNTWETQSLDTLGLTEGQYCFIQFFIAFNTSTDFGLRVGTNFALEEDYMVALSQWIIGSGTITPAAGAYAPGSQTIVASAGAGYELASLTLDGDPITSGSSQAITDHAVIAAIFTRLHRTGDPCTRDEIIAAALRKCQVLAEGDLPTNDQISTGAEALERFMHHSQSDCEFRWQFIQRTQAIASGEQTITLTDSADVLDVYNAFLRDANGMDTPLRLVDAHWYDSTLAAKSTSDALPAVALASFNRDADTNIASVSLSIYPKPAQAYTLYYRAMIKHYILEAGTSEANFDEMWCEVVVYGLAARLADEYNRTERAVYLEQKFEKLKDAAKRKTGATRDSLTMFPV